MSNFFHCKAARSSANALIGSSETAITSASSRDKICFFISFVSSFQIFNIFVNARGRLHTRRGAG